MPGHLDVWSDVQFSTPTTGPSTDSPLSASHAAEPNDRRWWRRARTVPLVAATVGLVVLGGGGTAYASAHKSVTLDVDGSVQKVSTFAGSVQGLLAAHRRAEADHSAKLWALLVFCLWYAIFIDRTIDPAIEDPHSALLMNPAR